MCVALCVFVYGWLKKGFYLQHLWTANCIRDLFVWVTRGGLGAKNRRINVPREPAQKSETGSSGGKKSRK